MTEYCNTFEFCKNLTEYRVVCNKVYFYTNVNGVMIPDSEMVPLNKSYTGSLDFINNNIYIDIGLNNYIPVFDIVTGDVLVTTIANQFHHFTQNCPERSSLPTKI